jgi:hypothetical protein
MFPGNHKHRAPTISYFYEYVEAIIGETSGMMSVWKRKGNSQGWRGTSKKEEL